LGQRTALLAGPNGVLLRRLIMIELGLLALTLTFLFLLRTWDRGYGK
jgi:hypothetical protein